MWTYAGTAEPTKTLIFKQTGLYENPEIPIVHRMRLNENTSHKVVLSTA